MSYRWTSLRDVDTKEWSELVRAISDADGTGEYYSAEDLAEELEEDGVDIDTDTIGVYAGAALVGYGQLTLRSTPVDGYAIARITGGVHPEHRGRGVGRELFGRQEAAARARAAVLHPDLPARISGSADVAVASHVALLGHRGYRPQRYFLTLRRAITAADASLPADPRSRPYEPGLAETVRLAHITAFSSHWSFAPPSPVEWHQGRVGSRTFRPAESIVLSAGGDRRVDGYVLSYQFEDGELYLGQVGTVPSARKQGLASAGLRTVIGLAARAGYTRVSLDVDSANEDGAGSLYTGAGFRQMHTTAVFRRPE